MSELLVVEGCSLQATTGSASILPASLKLNAVKCSGKKVYSTIAFSVTDGLFAGAGVIAGNSVKITSGGFPAVLADASISIVLVGPMGATKPCTVSIGSAGQGKVRGE